MQRISHVHHSHPELIMIMSDLVECLHEVHKALIEWLLVLACLVHLFWDLVSCLSSLSESRMFVCYFCFGLHSDTFQHDPKKNLACVWDKSNCSVICTLFKIAYLGKWDERGERPLHSRIATHITSILSSTVRLSSSFEQFCWDLICGVATCCLTYGKSNLWTKWRRLLISIFLFNSFPFFIMVQLFTIPFPPLRDLCSFSRNNRQQCCRFWQQFRKTFCPYDKF